MTVCLDKSGFLISFSFFKIQGVTRGPAHEGLCVFVGVGVKGFLTPAAPQGDDWVMSLLSK